MAAVAMADGRQLLDQALSVPAVKLLADRLTPGFTPAVLLVGGAVRDLLLGSPVDPVDIDLMVEGPVEALGPVLGAEQLRVHDRFSTATLELNGTRLDIARARRESYAAPGTLPAVRPATALEDLGRRDFTVNAIALVLTGPARGELLSAPGALDDLAARLLRVLHERSFGDDPTRLLRLARYAARLGFEIEQHTRELALSAVREGALATVSGTRIGNELRLLAAEEDPVAALRSLASLGLDQAVDPALNAGPEQISLLVRALGVLPEGERRDRLVLAVALAGAPAARAEALLDRLGFTAEDRDVVVIAASRAAALAKRLEAATRPSEIDRAVGASAGEGPAQAELVALAGALGPSEAAREWLTRLRARQLEITGADLIAAGVPEGPAVGSGLAAARAAMLDGRAPDRERQLAMALSERDPQAPLDA